MEISGRIVKMGDDINTDIIVPGKYMIYMEPADLEKIAFEPLGEDFRKQMKMSQIVVAGRNFGCGSAREQGATAVKAMGIKAVIAKSFARTFFRNAINSGLTVIEQADVSDAAENGEQATIFIDKNTVEYKGKEYGFPSLPAGVAGILEAGGLAKYLKKVIEGGNVQPLVEPKKTTGKKAKPMTIAEKILAKKSGKESTSAGDIVEAYPDVVLSHYATYRVVNVFKKLGVDRFWDKDRIRIILDHRSPPKQADQADQEKIGRDFARKNNISFHDINEGICHAILIQNGEILPGMLVVGTDSHSPIYGCTGAFGTGIGYTETASIWLTGKLWMKVPETYKISFQGKSLPRGVLPKDLILTIVGKMTADGCTYRAVEFYGDLMSNMTVSDRMTLCCLAVEMGVKTAICPPDKITADYLKNRAKKDFSVVLADNGASYAKELTFESDKMVPVVSIPHNVDKVAHISSIERVRIDQAFVGSCSNGSVEDLEIVARMLKGRKVAPNVRLLVSPSSKSNLMQIIKSGAAADIIESGALIINPGCATCAGDGGSIGDGEVCISSSTRNFLARMGSAKGQIYLGSPATVTASAIKGEITDPREFF